MLSFTTWAQDEPVEETYFDLVLPSQDEFIAQLYGSYKSGFEKFCDQPFMTEEDFREQMLNVNYLNAKEEVTSRSSAAYKKMIDTFEQRVERKFENLDVFTSDEKPDDATDDVRLTTKITNEVRDYNGTILFAPSMLMTGCKGMINWYLEIYKGNQLIAKGEIMFATVKKKYNDPLQSFDHKVLIEGLKGAGVK